MRNLKKQSHVFYIYKNRLQIHLDNGTITTETGGVTSPLSYLIQKIRMENIRLI